MVKVSIPMSLDMNTLENGRTTKETERVLHFFLMEEGTLGNGWTTK